MSMFLNLVSVLYQKKKKRNRYKLDFSYATHKKIYDMS